MREARGNDTTDPLMSRPAPPFVSIRAQLLGAHKALTGDRAGTSFPPGQSQR